MDTLQIEQQASFSIYPKRDLVITRGKDATLWDENGNAYIDCIAGIGVANVGHANAEVADAISAQARKLITCPGIFYNDTRAQFVSRLREITPNGLDRVFLCNSGTEAIEAAIKFTRHTTGKSGFVCAMRGFHGRTMGALSATHKYRDRFEPLLSGFGFVPYGNLDKLKDKLTDDTAGVILEIVQGEGGVRPGSREYFQGVQAVCREKGILLIIDEIQTGFCRTGKMFACEHVDVQPDLLCLAKAMGGGLPIGAVVCASSVTAEIGLHGSTFGGNPIACAAALAAIDFMESNQLAHHAAEKGEFFKSVFERKTLSRVRELRQIGLMIGIELKEKSKPVLLKLMEKGILALPAGATVVRLLPPLVISHDELEAVAIALHEILAD
jgi:acetylornithine/LysW-gamma-L-lysine aminotransferase